MTVLLLKVILLTVAWHCSGAFCITKLQVRNVTCFSLCFDETDDFPASNCKFISIAYFNFVQTLSVCMFYARVCVLSYVVRVMCDCMLCPRMKQWAVAMTSASVKEFVLLLWIICWFLFRSFTRKAADEFSSNLRKETGVGRRARRKPILETIWVRIWGFLFVGQGFLCHF